MTYCTGKRAGRVSPWSRSTCTPSRCSSSDGPSYQGIASLRCTTLSPCSAAIGMAVTSGSAPKRVRRSSVSAVKSRDDVGVDALVVADEVHLVDRQHEVGHPQQRRQRGVPAGLLDHALAGVDEHQREVGGRGAGDHVAGVLHVARGVGHDERAHRRGEVAVGDVDRDALLALGPQAVGEQREVGVVVAAVGAGALDGLELVLEDRLGVVEQPADERRLAVVDGAGGGEAQEVAQGCGH